MNIAERAHIVELREELLDELVRTPMPSSRPDSALLSLLTLGSRSLRSEMWP
jgi:hypothetical protein